MIGEVLGRQVRATVATIRSQEGGAHVLASAEVISGGAGGPGDGPVGCGSHAARHAAASVQPSTNRVMRGGRRMGASLVSRPAWDNRPPMDAADLLARSPTERVL